MMLGHHLHDLRWDSWQTSQYFEAVINMLAQLNTLGGSEQAALVQQAIRHTRLTHIHQGHAESQIFKCLPGNAQMATEYGAPDGAAESVVIAVVIFVAHTGQPDHGIRITDQAIHYPR